MCVCVCVCVRVCRPNVCVRTTESFDVRDDDDDDDESHHHHHHHFAMSTVCDDSNNVYKCTITCVYMLRHFRHRITVTSAVMSVVSVTSSCI